MSIQSPPRTGRLLWTAYTPVEGDSSPIDPLRLDTYAERLGNVLFPGVTNRVERCRYFGMVCAGLRSAAASVDPTVGGRTHTQAIRHAFVPYEAAWVYANVVAEGGPGIKERIDGSPMPRLRHAFRGLRGANRALAFWHETKDDARVDGRKGYRLLQAQEAQGGLGSYLVALRHHGFVHPDRLALTAMGVDLAQAFEESAKRRAVREALADDGLRDRGVWERAGEQLSLAYPTPEERATVGNALFGKSSSLGRFVSLLPEELRVPERAREAFVLVARSNEGLASDAEYALRFDALRRCSLELFARVGEALVIESAPRRVEDVLPRDELQAMARAVTIAAERVSTLAPPPGLHPVASLAVELGGLDDDSAVFAALIDFHHREGRRWIERMGANRYALGVPADFRAAGDGFHGFTLPAALSVYRDVAAEPA